jgi:hypothetical protein
MLGYVAGVVLPLSVLLGVSVFFEQETAPKTIRPNKAKGMLNLFILGVGLLFRHQLDLKV